MLNTKFFSGRSIKRFISLAVAAFLLFTCQGYVYPANEVPENIYQGIENASAILNNLDYIDVKNSNAWSTEAIYEAGAMGFMKGYGNKVFGRTAPVSKEQAIAIAYRIAGREADALMAAEKLDNARKQEDKKSDALSMWSDGYLLLAEKDGLITKQDLADAFTKDQASLRAGSFLRGAPAQRQEMAYWLAKALNLAPIFSQQKIFNSFNDWTGADPIKIPYIEAILQNNIMNGDGNGYFRPAQPISREQTAQVIKNAMSYIMPVLKLEKKLGTIESIDSSFNLSQGKRIEKTSINIRNSNGKQHQIALSSPNLLGDAGKNEQNGSLNEVKSKDLVVFKDGGVGTGKLLKAGDRIEYIVAPDKAVRYVKVISSSDDTSYIVAQINSIDRGRLEMEVSRFFTLDLPDIAMAPNYISFDMLGEKVNQIYTYSSNMEVFINSRKSGADRLKPDTLVILAVRDNVIVEARDFRMQIPQAGKSGIVKGIVEDNNPQLGYITLYDEDGTGTNPDAEARLIAFRTYNYVNQNAVEVFKNHSRATIDDIEVGDSVFMKLDTAGNVTSISAVENYIVRYAKVVSKRTDTMVVEYEDGDWQVLEIDSSIPVVAQRRITGYKNLKEGDRVRLLLHVTNKFTTVKEISIEGKERLITNIYKGTVAYIDEMSNKLIVSNMELLNGGQWIRTEKKGTSGIMLSEDLNMYLGEIKVDIKRVNKLLRNNEAYIAVGKDYGSNEVAVAVSFRNRDDYEKLYDDTVANTSIAKGEFGLINDYSKIKCNSGTIVVKDGRLVSAGSISAEDAAYVVANRSDATNEFFAGIVQIGEKIDTNLPEIYRARIKSINENRDFTVESFSRLKGTRWEYFNTPKTFKLTHNSSIVDESGVVGQRDFTDYGANSYGGRTVYVIAKDTEAVLVSTAPYGTFNIKGILYEITGGNIGEEGTWIDEPTGFKLKDTRIYNPANFLWEDKREATLSILKNSIIIKGNKLIKPSELKKDNKIRAIKKDDTINGEAYIIIVEN